MTLIKGDDLDDFRAELMADAVGAVSDQMAFGIFGALMAFARDCPEVGAEILTKSTRCYLEAVRHCHGHDEALVRGDQLASDISDTLDQIEAEEENGLGSETIQAILIAYDEYKR